MADYPLTLLGRVIWEDRYGLKDSDGKLIEKSILETFTRNATAVASKEADPARWSEEFYGIMANGQFCPAGRILAQAGTHYSQLLNCFVLPFRDDSLEEIMHTASDIAVTQKFGGGVGLNYSKLRPSGSHIKGVNGHSCGVIGFLGMLSTVSEVIEQGGCLTQDTLINTEGGLLYLKEIINQQDDICRTSGLPGQGWYDHSLLVKTKDGVKESKRLYVNGYSDILSIKTESGVELKGTYNHKLQVFTKEGPVWKEFNDVQRGDWVVSLLGQHAGVAQSLNTEIPKRHHNCIVPDNLPTELTEEVAFFLGYFTGNGFSTVKDGDHRIGVTIPDYSYLSGDRIQEIYKSLFGANISTNILKKSNDESTTYLISNRIIKEYLAVNGLLKHKSTEASVPDKIRKSPVNVVAAYMAGLFEADGSVTHGYPSLSSTSRVLIQEVYALLFGLGIPCEMRDIPRGLMSFSSTMMYGLKVSSSLGLNQWNSVVHHHPLSRFSKCSTHAADLSREKAYVLPCAEYWIKKAFDSLAKAHDVGASKLRKQLGRYLRGDRNITWSSYQALLGDGRISALLPSVNSMFFSRVASITPGEDYTFDIEVEESHSYVANSVISHNSRRGANLGLLEVWHPDVWEFISYKTDHNWDRLLDFMEVKDRAKWAAFKYENLYKWQMYNVSVGVNDEFLDAVKHNLEWEFVWKGENWLLHTVEHRNKGNLVGSYTVTANNDSVAIWKVKKVIPFPTSDDKFIVVDRRKARAKEVWERICHNAWADGCPGLLNMSTIRRMHNMEYVHPVESTNPCLLGNSLILTSYGLSRIEDLDGSGAVRIWNGSKWSESTVFCSGVKPVYEMRLSNGMVLRGTLDHRVFSGDEEVQLGDTLGKVVDRMVGSDWVGVRAESVTDDQMVCAGFVFGDGNYQKASSRYKYVYIGQDDGDVESLLHEIGEELPEANWSDKRIISPEFASSVCEKLGFPHVSLPERTLSERILALPPEQIQLFLRGLYSANGSVLMAGRVTYKSCCKTLIEQLQTLLMALGIKSYWTVNKAHEVEFSNGVYGCQESYDLNITSDDIDVFRDKIGFVQAYKVAKLNDICGLKRGRRLQPKVTSITYLGEEKVYDFTEPELHCGFVNGLKVHNCGEQPLPANSCCLLGSLILPAFVDKTGPTPKIDYALLSKATRTAVRLMDDVIDNCDFPRPEMREMELSERRIGLGTMGVHDMLMEFELGYDSEAGRALVESVLEVIRDSAYLASIDIAKEKGSFPLFNKEKFLESGFIKTLPQVIRDAIAAFGIRNCCILSQAPTGTIATMLNKSTGCEPWFDLAYERNTRLGSYEDGCDTFIRWKKANPGKETPSYFRTAQDIKPEDHLAMMVLFSRYNDSATSKTLNLPNETTVEDVSRIYLSAMAAGVKGVTVFRDGCKEGVLVRKKTEAATQDVIPEEDEEEVVLVDDGDTRQSPLKRGDRTEGATTRIQMQGHNMYVTVNRNMEGQMVEVFATVGESKNPMVHHTSGVEDSWAEGLGKIASLALRAGVEPKSIIRNLKNIPSDKPMFTTVGDSDHSELLPSPPHAIARVMEEELKRIPNTNTDRIQTVETHEGAQCRSCGSTKLWWRTPTCYECRDCQVSSCSG